LRRRETSTKKIGVPSEAVESRFIRDSADVVPPHRQLMPLGTFQSGPQPRIENLPQAPKSFVLLSSVTSVIITRQLGLNGMDKSLTRMAHNWDTEALICIKGPVSSRAPALPVQIMLPSRDKPQTRLLEAAETCLNLISSGNGSTYKMCST
jgi:hypothetical protein